MKVKQEDWVQAGSIQLKRYARVKKKLSQSLSKAAFALTSHIYQYVPSDT